MSTKAKAWWRRRVRKKIRRAIKDKDAGDRIGNRKLANHYWGDGPNRRSFPPLQDDHIQTD